MIGWKKVMYSARFFVLVNLSRIDRKNSVTLKVIQEREIDCESFRCFNTGKQFLQRKNIGRAKINRIRFQKGKKSQGRKNHTPSSKTEKMRRKISFKES